MSKLSKTLKALINAPHARPDTTPAPANIYNVYEQIAADARTNNVGLPIWLCATTAATMTLNSPESLLELHRLASTESKHTSENPPVYAAEFIREVGLKCVGINGVPRVINTLGAFRQGLPKEVQSALDARKPRRTLSQSNVETSISRGNWLWNSIYHPFTDKLTSKLGQSHPDLPVHIIESEYGNLFSDPVASQLSDPLRPDIGRILTSVMAISCLRSQGGVGPQVVSHVFGLRKAFDDGTAEGEDKVPGGKWLASDDGGVWLLGKVDEVVEAIGRGRGTTFASGLGEGGGGGGGRKGEGKAKL